MGLITSSEFQLIAIRLNFASKESKGISPFTLLRSKWHTKHAKWNKGAAYNIWYHRSAAPLFSLKTWRMSFRTQREISLLWSADLRIVQRFKTLNY